MHFLSRKRPEIRFADTQRQDLENKIALSIWAARASFEFYIRYIFNADKPDGEQYVFDSYHKVLLQEMWDWFWLNKTDNLMFLLPPRSGKSTLGSILFPTWLVGIMSDKVLREGAKTPYEIIQSSYSMSLLKEFSAAQVSYYESNVWQSIFPEVRVAPQMGQRYGSQFSRSGDHMDFIADMNAPFGVFRESGGEYKKAATIRMVPRRGQVTGKGANLIILDDMMKDNIDADSALNREKLQTWWESTLYTRVEDRHGRRAKILALNTKWHEDDLTSYFERKGNWRVVRFPAFAYPENHKLRHPKDKRKEDEVLSKRLASTYNRVRKSQGFESRTFVTLYQQIAVALAGNIIKGAWIQFYKPEETPSSFSFKVISIDLPFKGNKKEVAEAAKKATSFAVFETWGLDAKENKYYLLDQRRGQYDFVKQEEVFEEFVKANMDTNTILLEDAANAQALFARMRRKYFNIEMIPPKESKELRLRLVEHLYKQKRVYYPHPDQNSWVNKNIEEITKFPAYKTKDTVDTASMALDHLKGKVEDLSLLDALSAF